MLEIYPIKINYNYKKREIINKRKKFININNKLKKEIKVLNL